MGRFRPESSSFPSSNTNLELQLLTTSSTPMSTSIPSNQENNHQDYTPELQLSIGPSSCYAPRNELHDHENFLSRNVSKCCIISNHEKASNFALASRVKGQAEEQLKLAMAEKAYAEEARRQAKRQIELAEEEFGNAKRIRQQAQEELERTQALREHAINEVSSTFMQITCYSCKQKFQAAIVNNNNNTSTSSFQENED
ncbi:hypothetical protein Leryth_020110 [Lithospermum erythrorhizon]|uniref:Uncharacterized protein n=1 Tax=Lithospermum erythrorhizon TaxID=34254 RepID=A0AAV3RQM1_LITER|nr:hypothetical protein Leryth_020110 [Lithospermum erythrorhizon]